MKWFLMTLTLAFSSGFLFSQADDEHPWADLDAPEHRYWESELEDPFTKFIEEINRGAVQFDTSSEMAFVVDLLGKLEIPLSSQMLVFSTTSLQLRLINPQNPRAIYFNEDLYVGWVPGGEIEVISIDPKLGGIFYIFGIPRSPGALSFDRSDRCMNCHLKSVSGYVPGISIKSVIPGTRGGSMDSFRRGLIGHGIPLADRFGGWHVTGGESIPAHKGNVNGQYVDGNLETYPLEPGTQFSWDQYPVATSDVLAQMIHEHQGGFVNLVVEANWRARTYLRQGGGKLSPENLAALQELADRMVRYILFADEAELPAGGLETDPQFQADFLAQKTVASNGFSLRDLDLETRMFRFRCSYMIGSNAFTGLHEAYRNLVIRKLAEALAGGKDGAHLDAEEREVIRQILSEMFG